MPDEQWYICRAGHQVGPISQQQIEHFKSTGKLAPTDDVWIDSFTDWKLASEVFRFDTGPLLRHRSTEAKAISVGAISRLVGARNGLRLRSTKKNKIVVLLVCLVCLFTAGYYVFDWYLTRSIRSSLFAAMREAGERQQDRLDLLTAYFECGAGPQETGTYAAPRTDLLQTNIIHDGDDSAFSFVTDSKWTVVEGGQKKVSRVHFSVRWSDISHVTIDENVLLFYCRDCTRQIQGDINSMLDKNTDVPGRLKTPVMTYTFCDADTARKAMLTIENITDRVLSKFVYEDDKDPVEASTIEP